MRRWSPGTFHSVNGLKFRIVRGRKTNYFGEEVDDFVLEVSTPEGWRKVHMHLAGFITDFLTENEDVLFPRYRDGYRTSLQGGQKLLNYLRDARKYGWEKAEDELQRERAAKQTLFDQEAS